jgi:hypothetical protein
MPFGPRIQLNSAQSRERSAEAEGAIRPSHSHTSRAVWRLHFRVAPEARGENNIVPRGALRGGYGRPGVALAIFLGEEVGCGDRRQSRRSDAEVF